MDDNTSHIGSDDRATAWWRWLTRRIVLLPLAALVIVGVGVWVFMQMRGTSTKQQSALQSAINAADSASVAGNYGKSYDQLKQALSQATSTSDKVGLYNDLSAAAASDGKVTEAINYLNQKHALDPSTVGQDAYTLGDYYARIGDNSNALAQYKLALKYAQSQPSTQRTRADIQGLKDLIQSLGGSQ